MKVEDAMDAADNAKAALSTGASLWHTLMNPDVLPAQETEAALAAERVEIMRELLMEAVDKAARARVGSREWAERCRVAEDAAKAYMNRVRELQDQLLAARKYIGGLEARVAKKRRKK
jgi:hypothetical protein